jgi:thiol-disulfide isomerase/thioredoxin
MGAHAYYALPFEPVKRLLVVTFLVLVASMGYRTYGSPETGTGSLTLKQPAPNTGEKAPVFEAALQDGGKFELSDKGVYVLTFWSTLNKDTADIRPKFEQMARDYEGKGVSFAAVYVSNIPELGENVPYAVLQDDSGELTAMYNVKRVPRLFLISDGTIEMVQNGYYPENEERLREKLDQVLPEVA